MNSSRLRFGKTKALLGFLALTALTVQTTGLAEAASTITTHTRTRVTTTATLTETTTAISNAIGPRGYLVLLVLLAGAASCAVLGGYIWGRRRTRRALLGVTD